MRRARMVCTFLAAALFILQGGDCLSLLFASHEARECCRKGQCSPKNPDPCCQVSSKTTVTQNQAQEREHGVKLAPMIVTTWVSPVSVAHLDFGSASYSTFPPSPPGELGNFSLPLLV